MNRAIEKENENLLMKLRDIHIKLGETTNSIGKELNQKSSAEIQKKILEIKVQLKELKSHHNQSLIVVKGSKIQKKRTIEEKVKDLEIEDILKKEARALDTAITKVARAEKYCDSTLNKVKVELLSAELACFEVVKAKIDLDGLVHHN